MTDLNRREPRCETMVCGNYDQNYANCCRAMTGAVPDDPFDCAAFCSFAEATAVDRRALAMCENPREYAALRHEITRRDNPRRRPARYPVWRKGEGNPMRKR